MADIIKFPGPDNEKRNDLSEMSQSELQDYISSIFEMYKDEAVANRISVRIKMLYKMVHGLPWDEED